MAFYRLKFTPEAVRDIKSASDYYEDCQKGLGKRFRSEVKSKLVRVKQSPLIYAVRYGEVRFALTEIFPYSIHYTVSDTRQQIQIHAVLCDYRSPEKFWLKDK
jgi:plasmid stabilization system protein ParE